MNRRQRRVAGRHPSANKVPSSEIRSVFNHALQYHRAGRLADAERGYRHVLDADPRHADSLHLLGVAASQGGNFDAAIDLIGKAVTIRPDYPEAHMNLGHVLLQKGELQRAADSYRKTLEFAPNTVEVLVNLGNILGDLGKPDEAMACYRRALAARPDFAEAHVSLGVTLYGLGRLDEAIACYRRALEIKPDFVIALDNLASALIAQGKPAAALNVARRSLQIEESDSAKGILVSCLGRLQDATDEGLRPIVERALFESWGGPGELARACIDLLKLDQEIAGCVALAADAWPRPLPGEALFGAGGALAALAADRLLFGLLDAAPLCDIEMERFLTAARRVLLDAACEASGSETGLAFYSALARQCFINEYVFAVAPDERRLANDLRASLSIALEAGEPVPVLHVVAVAAYFPLYSLPLADRLLDRSWPEAIPPLLTQQLREPAEERGIGALIPRLTEIEDDVSVRVQRQYEESPYPRWLRAPPSRQADSIEAYLRQTFPLANFGRSQAGSGVDILVAGCGTGQQPIRTSQQFPQARILAIDLSRSSLAYAARKTRHLGLSSIDYAQADLLKLGSLDRQFDVIEAVGVLHHLADPWAGWRILLTLLRPGGFMRLGLYSDTARQEVVRLQKSIAEQGYGTTAEEIRRCRQDLMTSLGEGAGAADGCASDLFTISGFRDLLLHVQEHRFSLGEIARFLHENDLTFLGFDIAPDVLHRYRALFPGDAAATDLGQWQVFEAENPHTFVGMYQFWIQKRCPAAET